MTLDELDRTVNSVFGDSVTLTKALAHDLIARLRATDALVERAYVEGFEDGEQVATFPHRNRSWDDSNVRRALDRLREGK